MKFPADVILTMSLNMVCPQCARVAAVQTATKEHPLHGNEFLSMNCPNCGWYSVARYDDPEEHPRSVTGFVRLDVAGQTQS